MQPIDYSDVKPFTITQVSTTHDLRKPDGMNDPSNLALIALLGVVAVIAYLAHQKFKGDKS
jgi:hypothetical protein